MSPPFNQDFVAQNEPTREKAKNLIIELWNGFPNIRFSEKEVEKAIMSGDTLNSLVKNNFLLVSETVTAGEINRFYSIGPNGILLVQSWEGNVVAKTSLDVAKTSLHIAIASTVLPFLSLMILVVEKRENADTVIFVTITIILLAVVILLLNKIANGLRRT
ncbi:MAG: hypothetical protein AABY11_02510 [archaeon]